MLEENKTYEKKISFLLCLVMILSLFTIIPFSVGAKEVEKSSSEIISGDYEYKLLDDGTVEITGYYGSDTNLIIPSTLDGYTVTGIGWDAFNDCSSLTLLMKNVFCTIIDYV